MQRSCTLCSAGFVIDDRDLAFYDKVSPEFAGKKIAIPPPTLCPDCRLQRRLAWRMERTLYFRTCDATKKKIMSVFPQDSPYKVFHPEAWYGDSWSALEYGRPFDFNRTLTEQMQELMRAVPLLALSVVGTQNCEFVNQIGFSKNSYLIFEGDYNEDCLYGYRVFFNKVSVDCTEVVRSQQCYECVDCDTCFNLRWSQLCKQCSDSAFLYDCRGCASCFGCAGLRQKKFCVFNKQLDEQQYRQMIVSFDQTNSGHWKAAWEQFEKIKLALPRRAFIGEQNENVSGNYIYESKDTTECFNVRACRDCRYCDMIRESKDCMDYTVWGATAQLIYECGTSGVGLQNLRFCSECWENCHDLLYCFQCINGTGDCIGCVGLRHQKYCILNKQYTKEEYEQLAPKIIEHMQRTGEWGEFFPVSASPYGYNETTAQEYFPLKKEEAVARGWKWRDVLPSHAGTGNAVPAPSGDAVHVPDAAVDQIFACEATGKPYRITTQELRFYRDNHLPLPRLHPDERHRRRMLLRNPRKLWTRTCGKCGKPVQTSYAPERQEKIVCEECYLKEVY